MRKLGCCLCTEAKVTIAKRIEEGDFADAPVEEPE